MSDAFEPEHPDWNTVEVLAARVDELMVLAGAVKAALARTRTVQDTLGQDPEQLTEDQIEVLPVDLTPFARGSSPAGRMSLCRRSIQMSSRGMWSCRGRSPWLFDDPRSCDSFRGR